MTNIKKFSARRDTKLDSSLDSQKKGEVVDIDKKINKAIQLRLGKFVKEIQELKSKQKRLEASHKVRNKMRSNKKKKKKGKTIAHKKPKK